jgi:hypothetical protein
MDGEQIMKVQLALQQAEPGCAEQFTRWEFSADAEQPGFLENLARHGLNCPGVFRILRTNDAPDVLVVLNSSARENIMPGHEFHRRVSLGQEDLRLVVAAHEDAGRGKSRFSGHGYQFYSENASVSPPSRF